MNRCLAVLGLGTILSALFAATADSPHLKPRVPVQPPVAALAFRPDGKLLAAAVHKQVLLFDPATGKEIGKLGPHDDRVTAVAFSPDGKSLASAGGAAGRGGELRLWDVEERKLRATPKGHKDTIYGLAFSPDGRLLASGSFDKLIILWDAVTGHEVRRLKDHTDAIYALAFRPDGKRLASAAADRTVKLWDVGAGRRLYTISDASDSLYALDFHPQGQQLSAAGADKMIRTWNLEENGASLARSAFAHQRPVLRLLYAPDGGTLYTTSEDRLLKVWDAATLTERRVLEREPDWALSLALSADGTKLAVGRFDGSLSIDDAASGQRLLDPLAASPPPSAPPVRKGAFVPPALRNLSPPGVQRGKTVVVTLDGPNVSQADEVHFSDPGFTAKLLRDEKATNRNQVKAEINVPAEARPCIHSLFLHTPLGTTNRVTFAVGTLPEVAEKEANDTIATVQRVPLNTTVVGTINKPGDMDHFAFEVRAGQQIVFEIVAAPLRSQLNGILTLLDSSGKMLAENNDYDGRQDPLLAHAFAADGVYVIRVSDLENSGGGGHHYRLNVGDFPYLTSVFPPGLRAGTTAELAVTGYNLGDVKTVSVKAPETAVWGQTLSIKAVTPKGESLNQLRIAVGTSAETQEQETTGGPAEAQRLPVPGTISGRIQKGTAKPGEGDWYRFAAKKGQPLILESMARRLGSPLDAVLEVLDLNGQPLPRATLRSVAESAITLNDPGSVQPNLRFLHWNDFQPDDFIYLNGEVLRIRALPLHPDADLNMWAFRGQRIAYLDTTPQQQALGTAIYKVQIHPPGKTFPPNGMPVFTLDYRNDDAGPLFGKDSRLRFDPPAGGEYLVRVSDVRGQGSERHNYRLTVREPAPDFRVTVSPDQPGIPAGGSIPVEVTAERLDDFDGRIEVVAEGLPAGVTATPTAIPAGEYTAVFTLTADNAAANVSRGNPRLRCKAMIGGKEVVRTTPLGIITVTPSPDLIVTVPQPEQVTVRPGQKFTLHAAIERQNGFNGRVPMDVKNLPHGVRILDIGLNGVLINEAEKTRRIELVADPYVQPTVQFIYVTGRIETESSAPSEHASRPIRLRINPAEARRSGVP